MRSFEDGARGHTLRSFEHLIAAFWGRACSGRRRGSRLTVNRHPLRFGRKDGLGQPLVVVGDRVCGRGIPLMGQKEDQQFG